MIQHAFSKRGGEIRLGADWVGGSCHLDGQLHVGASMQLRRSV